MAEVRRDSALRRPARLRAGDRVAVVAPSGPVDPALLETGCALLRDLELDVVVGKHALDQDSAGGNPPQPPRGAAPGGRPPRDLPGHLSHLAGAGAGISYLAGADADRAADLQAAWCDPDVAAVFCARGGYGAARVLDHLDWAALRAAGPKILHGSSDITALHVTFGDRLSLRTSFGPMIACSPLAGQEPRSLAAFTSALFETPAERLRGTQPLADGQATGILTGGNLSLLASLTGTPYAPAPASGAIAFLEDIDEAPYRIDRMITQLLHAGWFDGVAGIVLGSWVGCGTLDELDAVLADRLCPLGVPVLAGVPVGHGSPQFTVELGAEVHLDAGAGAVDLS